MATLTNAQKQTIRNWMEQKANSSGVQITYVKAAINDAAQAVEDLLVSSAGTISTAINNASQPHGVTFTANQKKILVPLLMYVKYLADKDG